MLKHQHAHTWTHTLPDSFHFAAWHHMSENILHAHPSHMGSLLGLTNNKGGKLKGKGTRDLGEGLGAVTLTKRDIDTPL